MFHQIVLTFTMKLSIAPVSKKTFNTLLTHYELNVMKPSVLLCTAGRLTLLPICMHTHTLGAESYHPLGAEQINDNRLFSMYHANISTHNKAVIQASMQDLKELFELFLQLLLVGWV